MQLNNQHVTHTNTLNALLGVLRLWMSATYPTHIHRQCSEMCSSCRGKLGWVGWRVVFMPSVERVVVFFCLSSDVIYLTRLSDMHMGIAVSHNLTFITFSCLLPSICTIRLVFSLSESIYRTQLT